MSEKWKKFWKQESGMGVIEVVMIVVVLVGLAVLFKGQINSIATALFTSLRQQVGKF